MDIYGIGASIRASLSILQHSGRRTGRTAHLISNLRDGDTVLCASDGSARDIEHRARAEGKRVRTIVAGGMGDAFRAINGLEGGLVANHDFIEKVYADEVRRIDRGLFELFRMQDQEKRWREIRMPTLRWDDVPPP